MKKLKTRYFSQWQKKAGLSDKCLQAAADDLHDAKSAPGIGKFLYKVRVRREGRGKSGGYRTIVVCRKNELVLFSYGFGKNEKGNLDKKELKYWRKFAKDICGMGEKDVKKAVAAGEFIELEENKDA